MNITKIADKLCSHQPQLKPFDDVDWMGYAGCETPNPEIAYTEKGTFVLDGCAVHVELERVEGDPEDCAHDLFVDEFASEAEARNVAEFLILNPDLVPKLLGLAVGSTGI